MMAPRLHGFVSKGLTPPRVKKTFKTLEGMKANPKGDWTISDVQTVCNHVGLTCTNRSGGSHYVISSEHLNGIQSIPAKRPIKPAYIKSFVGMVEAHISVSEQETADDQR